MSRTIKEIEDAIIAKREELIPELSTSQSAEWRLWIYIFAYGTWLFEQIMDLFKSDVEEILANKQPGSLTWMVEKAKEFQLGHSLTVNSKGVLGYALTDEEAQIVKHASASENEDGDVLLKVAKVDSESGELVPLNLTNGEF